MVVDLSIGDGLKDYLKEVLIKNEGNLSGALIKKLIEDKLNTVGGVWYLINFDLARKMNIDTGKHIWITGSYAFRRFEIGGFLVSSVLRKSNVLPKDIFLLQFLDLLDYSKRMSTGELITRLSVYREVLMELDSEEVKNLVRLSRSYRPFVRIILAFLWESLGNRKLYMRLSDTVNPHIFAKYAGKIKFA